MDTVIRIKKNNPALKALIIMAKELEKNNSSAISITEGSIKKKDIELIAPKGNTNDPSTYFDILSDFPTLNEIREKAWPKIL